MSLANLQRNSLKRYYLENSIYFVTTNIYRNYDYFREKVLCEILIDNLIIGKKLKQFKLYAFCILYNHLHFLVEPCVKYNVSKVIQNFKMNSSRNINKILGYENVGENTPALTRRGRYSRLQVERYDSIKSVFPKFKWQQSFHDHVIRNEKEFREHYNYTVYNFQKHDLPSNWKYTSLNYQKLTDEIIL